MYSIFTVKPIAAHHQFIQISLQQRHLMGSLNDIYIYISLVYIFMFITLKKYIFTLPLTYNEV